MICKIRKWVLEDAADLAAALSNRKVQDNLRDGLPYPYTEQDGVDFISAMLSADENETFAFAITADGHVVGKWIDNGQNNFDDVNTVILCVELTDGLLLSHGTRYEF